MNKPQADLKYLAIPQLKTVSGKAMPIRLSYQIFGQELHTAPVVIVNHALTGNSNVAGTTGWWKQLIGPSLGIDTNVYTVLAFNIPGNGFDNSVINNYKDYCTADVAHLFLAAIYELGLVSIHAVIGGSLGGCIAWQMGAINPDLFNWVVPVASHYCASDWLIALCRVQHEILLHSSKPVHDARVHAMTFYRSPESLRAKFNRTKNKENGLFNTESWLLHHGQKLEQRFSLEAYKLFNWMLLTHDIEAAGVGDIGNVIKRLAGKLCLVGVDSDRFYVSKDIAHTAQIAQEKNLKVFYKEIKSNAGHDAFLIEYKQLASLLSFVFSNNSE